MPLTVRRKSNVSLGSTVLEFSPQPAHPLQVSGQSHNSYSWLCFYTAGVFYTDDTVVVVVVVVLRCADAEPGGGGGRLTLCYCTTSLSPSTQGIDDDDKWGGGRSLCRTVPLCGTRTRAVSCPGDSRGRLSTPPS